MQNWEDEWQVRRPARCPSSRQAAARLGITCSGLPKVLPATIKLKAGLVLLLPPPLLQETLDGCGEHGDCIIHPN
jgi:hypothetical protein